MKAFSVTPVRALPDRPQDRIQGELPGGWDDLPNARDSFDIGPRKRFRLAAKCDRARNRCDSVTVFSLLLRKHQ
jgi:hypothetical protein